jgi:hypothetical protein
MCYDDCVGTYVIYQGEETVVFTGDTFGSFRRLNSKQEETKDKKAHKKSLSSRRRLDVGAIEYNAEGEE